jgi:hypothetical protein
MDVANNTWLQLLVVLGVPTTLAGLVWAGVAAHRYFKRNRTAAANLAVDLTLHGSLPPPMPDANSGSVLAGLGDLLKPD